MWPFTRQRSDTILRKEAAGEACLTTAAQNPTKEKRMTRQADNWSLGLVVWLLVTTTSATAQRNVTKFDETSDPPSTHNMVVVGAKNVFLSHLPMFDDLIEDKSDYTSMHRFQVILEARFVRQGKDVTNAYTKDRESNAGIKMYTLPLRTSHLSLSIYSSAKVTNSSWRT
jgi:hypothetical protein